MGQAKNRGSFEQRKIESIAAKAEVDRLNTWLRERQPVKKKQLVKKKARVSGIGLALCLMAPTVIPLYSREELAYRRFNSF